MYRDIMMIYHAYIKYIKLSLGSNVNYMDARIMFYILFITCI